MKKAEAIAFWAAQVLNVAAMISIIMSGHP